MVFSTIRQRTSGGQYHTHSHPVQIGRADCLARQKFLAKTRGSDATVRQHETPPRESQCVMRVLFHQQDCNTLLLVDLANHREYLLHQHRRQPKRGLIQQQEPWPCHERAPDSQHLLFSPGKGTGPLMAAFPQDGKARERPGDTLMGPIAGLFRRCSPHLEILQDAHAGEDTPTLRNQGDPPPDDPMGGEMSDIFPIEQYGPRAGAGITADGHEQGGFPGPVGADQGNDFSAFDRKIDVVKCLDSSIVGRDIADR